MAFRHLRILRRCLIVFLAVGSMSAPLAAQEPERSSVPGVAAGIWRGLDDVPWGATCEEWQTGSLEGRCSAPERDRAPRHPSDEWCAQGSASSVRGSLYFYGFRSDEPEHCGLGRYRAVVDSIPKSRAQTLHSLLERRLDGEYGAAERLDPRDDVPRYFFSFDWTRVRRWHTGESEILLYLEAEEEAQAAVGVIARSSALVEVADRADVSGSIYFQTLLMFAGGNTGDSITRTLDPSFPRATALLSGPPDHDRSSGWSDADAEEAVDVIDRLMRTADSTRAPERAAAMLFTADRLADRMASWVTRARHPLRDQGRSVDTTVVRSIVNRLDSLGVQPLRNELGAAWTYPHPLLFRIWENYGNTRTGEHAFLMLQVSGWDMSGMCREGQDQFRRVIRHGRAFLEQRPDSPIRAAVEYTLATAYETWWSAGRATGDPYIDPREYESGAGDAGERAIELYKRSARAFEGTAAGDAAVRRVARMVRGVDTFQRTYFCVYD